MAFQVKLELDSKNNSDLAEDGIHYTTSMTDNANFEAEDTVARVALTKTNLVKLVAAINAPISENKQPNIKVWRKVVMGDLTALGNFVENAANVPGLSEEESIAIIHSAGMDEKKQVKRGPQSFKVKKGLQPQSAFLTARGDAVAHMWYCTKDLVNFTNRIYPDGDTHANIEIPNLDKVEYAFFHRPIRANEVTGWEGPIFLTIT